MTVKFVLKDPGVKLRDFFVKKSECPQVQQKGCVKLSNRNSNKQLKF